MCLSQANVTMNLVGQCLCCKEIIIYVSFEKAFAPLEQEHVLTRMTMSISSVLKLLLLFVELQECGNAAGPGENMSL